MARSSQATNADRRGRSSWGDKKDDRCHECEVDGRHDGLDFEIDVEIIAKWPDIEVEIGKLDFDLNFDVRCLQLDTSPVVSRRGGEGTAAGRDTLVDADIFLSLDRMRRLRELELENSRLRRAVLDLTIDKIALLETLKGS